MNYNHLQIQEKASQTVRSSDKHYTIITQLPHILRFVQINNLLQMLLYFFRPDLD